MDFQRIRAQFTLEQGDRRLRLLTVKRLNHFIGQLFQTAVVQQRSRNRRAETGWRQVHNCIQTADGFDHFRHGDNNAGTHAGQADFRKTEAEDNVFMPIQRHIAVNNIRKRHSVSVVDNQRNPVFLRQSIQTRHLAVGQHIAGRISRARTANRTDFALFQLRQAFQRIKVHAVFEKARFAFVFDIFDFRLNRNKMLPFDMHVGITDIFRCQRQQNGFFNRLAV